VTDDPELKAMDSGDGEGGCADHGGEVLDLGETAYEEESEAVLLDVDVGIGIGWSGLKPVDSVVDAGDAVAPCEGGVTEVLAGGVADAYDPVAEEGDEAVGYLVRGLVGRGYEAVARGDDALDAGEAGSDGSLKGWGGVVAVYDVRPGSAELFQESHEGAGKGGFAEDVYLDAFRTEDFA
jgi:hypothetical protein